MQDAQLSLAHRKTYTATGAVSAATESIVSANANICMVFIIVIPL